MLCLQFYSSNSTNTIKKVSNFEAFFYLPKTNRLLMIGKQTVMLEGNTKFDHSGNKRKPPIK